MQYKISLVGRPNVGKSTLFNRLVGKKMAIVAPEPGVTRDRKVGDGFLFDLSFHITDTAGWEEIPSSDLAQRMNDQTQKAINESDAIFFLFDAREGIIDQDQVFAQLLRQQKKPVLLLANKCEGSAGEAGYFEAYSLGLGDPIAVSAEHNQGFSEVYDKLKSVLKFESDIDDEELHFDDTETSQTNDDDDIDKPLRLAIIGRPNVGKSTFINSLIGEDRLITGPEAGITRDTIPIQWDVDGQKIKLVDTAGIRRKANVIEELEKRTVTETKRAVELSEVVALMIDGTQGLERQDLTIAKYAEEEGRAIILVINKWDIVKNKKETLDIIKEKIKHSLPQLKTLPFIMISALEKKSLHKFYPAIQELYQNWNKRFSTSPLNRWLEYTLEQHSLPMHKGKRVKIRYCSQIKSRPPTFVFWSNLPEGIPESYKNYLKTNLRSSFDIQGTPIRLIFKKGDNPYKKQ